MPSHLTFDDFSPATLTCELRYKSSYLLFDRTGQILEELRGSFTDINTVIGTPQQTTFASAQGTVVLELGACRFTTGELEKGVESFARLSKSFFDAVTTQLEISSFARIGLRYILRKEFKNASDSKAALAAMNLPNLKSAKRFNISEGPAEILFRWEDTQIGASVRLKTETLEIKINAPPEFRAHLPIVDKKVAVLTLDTDYYTVASVDRDQWDAQEWVLQKIRIIRKEVDDILQGGGK